MEMDAVQLAQLKLDGIVVMVILDYQIFVIHFKDH